MTLLTKIDLTTPQVRLRTTTAADQAVVGRMLADQETVSSAGLQLPDPLDRQSWNWAITTLVNSGRLLLVVDQERDQAAGVVLLSEIASNELEIGYLLAPAFRGRGLMTTAVRLLLDSLAQGQRSRVVVAHTKRDNVASINVLKRAGFIKQPITPDGQIIKWQWISKKS